MALPDPMFEGWDVDSVAGGNITQHTPRSVRSQSYTARLEDISLQRFPEQEEESRFPGMSTIDFFDPDAGQLPVMDDTGMGIQRRDSQGRDVDANGDLIESDNSSVGVARDAPLQAGRPSLNVADMTGFDDFRVGDDFPMIGEGDIEGGLDLGLEEFEAERQRESTPIGTQSLMQDLTPRTALKVQQAAEKRAAATSGEKSRKQVVDSRTELEDELNQTKQANVAALLAKERYLPRSRAYKQLLEIHKNPSKHIFPFPSLMANGGDQTSFIHSRGLDPQLNELFTFDANTLRRRRSPSLDSQEDSRIEKRLRTESDQGDFSIGVGRRAERASLFGDDNFPDLAPDFSHDDFGGDEEMPLDLPAIEMDTSAVDLGLRRSTRKRVTDQEEQEDRNAYDQRGDLPRLATPSVAAEGETQGSIQSSPRSSNLLRAFDRSIHVDATNLAAETQASTQAGMSKNTARAIKILRKELRSGEEEEEEEEEEANVERQVSFQKVTTNATRRAAAGFFFELLVLGTKDCIKVEQEDSFGEIKIQAKPSLWTEESQLGQQ